jgi:hypothetical protein
VYRVWGHEVYHPDISTFNGFMSEWKVCEELGRKYKDSDVCICYISLHKIVHVSCTSLMSRCVTIFSFTPDENSTLLDDLYLWGVTEKVSYVSVRGWRSSFIVMTRLRPGWQRNQGFIPSRGRDISLPCGILTVSSYYLGSGCSDLDQFLLYVTC